MKKLRLLLTEKCNRNCEGCCNKDWDLKSLPVCDSYEGYDEIMITGGEPMLACAQCLYKVIIEMREQNPTAKIYMYTATHNIGNLYFVAKLVDGITYTIHEQADVELFELFDKLDCSNLSLRLNVFKGAKLTNKTKNNWKIRLGMKWIKHAPLPTDEVFMRYKKEV